MSSTVNLQYRNTKPSRSAAANTLKVATNLRNKMLMPGDDFLLKYPEPITYINRDTCFEQVDEYGMVFRYKATIADTDTVNLHLSDSVFFSVRGRTNDSLDVQIRRAREADFGNIYIKVSPPEGKQVVVQLLDGKDRVVDQCIVDSVARVGFTQLLPEKYKLQAIIDVDRNGRWSTGNFHRRFLPEVVVPYKDALDLKAGWDIDLDDVWDIQD